MQARRDQVQAQSYVLGRLTCALTVGDPEAHENPHRRIVLGSVAGLVIALLVMAGWTVFGFVKPGSASTWRQPGNLILDKNTGARYVLASGVLHPVLNYASAVLLFGRRPPVVSVSSASLSSTPRGSAVGIVGAPDALPDAAGLTGVTWQVCAMASMRTDGLTTAATFVTAGSSTTSEVPGPDQSLAVRTPDGQTFLLWGGYRYRVAADWTLRVFGLADPVTVDPGLLDQLPAQVDLSPPLVDGRGQPGPSLDGRSTRIGQVFVTDVVGTPQRYFLLLRDGLSPLTQTGLALALGDPAAASAYGGDPVRPLELSAAALSTAPMSSAVTLPATVPADPPRPAPGLPPGRTWCVREANDGGQARVVVDAAPTVASDSGGPGVSRTATTASVVRLRAGTGGLVRAGRAGRVNGDDLYLLTDAGIKFPVAGDATARTLGYDPASAATVSPALLNLLPTGPALDPAALAG